MSRHQFLNILKDFIYNNLFLFLLIYRLLNAFLLKTIFEPDEIWQNIEPINYLLLNKGELTWDWKVGIRSMNNVLLYYIPCFFLRLVLPNHYHLYCHYIYKLVNGLLASLLDYFTINLYLLYHRSISNIFFVTVFSHALWLYSPRSHINSLEMVVCVLTVYCYKTDKKRLATIMATYIGYLRPSSVCLNGLIFLKDLRFNLVLIPTALYTLLSMICIDSIFYKELIVPPYNFFYVNIYTKSSELFGKQPFYLYIPFLTVLCGILVLLAAQSFINEKKNVKIYLKLLKNKVIDSTVNAKISKYEFYKELVISVILYFTFYSLIEHKEMRFLLPLVPFINVLAAKMLNNKIRLILLGQLLVSIFIGLTHQKYSDTIDFLQNINCDNETNILYATCPYSLPGHSYVCHKNINIDFLTGEKDIFSKFKPKFYKRFGTDVKVDVYGKFISGAYKEFNFNKYHYVLVYDWSYKLMERQLDNFVCVAKKRYTFVNFEKDKGSIIYILKNILK